MAFQQLSCVAFDLDGTLLNKKSQLSERTRRMLQALDKKGIPAVIASGRPFSTIPQELISMPAVRYIVTGNGVCIYDTKRGKTVLRRSLSPEAVAAIVDMTQEYPLAYELFVDGRAYANEQYVRQPEMYGLHGLACQYIRKTRVPFADIRSFIQAHHGIIDSIGLSIQDMTLKEHLWQQLLQEIDNIYVTSSLPRLLEIADYRAGKRAALETILSYLDIAPSGLMAFGDADNDKGMIELAGLGVAMGNAEPAVKQVAKVVTVHHDEDGVAKIVEQYM